MSQARIQYPKPQYGPYLFSLISPLLLKELTLDLYLLLLQLVLCRVKALKIAPYIIHTADYIFLLYFEIREGIWEPGIINIGLDSFSGQFLNVGLNLVYISLCVDCLVKLFKITVFSLALFTRFLGSLTRIQHTKPWYGPFSFSLISSLLLKANLDYKRLN